MSQCDVCNRDVDDGVACGECQPDYSAELEELKQLRELAHLAALVVGERRAKINHARETTRMCRLAKAVDEFLATGTKRAARAARDGGAK